MTTLLLGFATGLYRFDTESDDGPQMIFPGVQPMTVAIDPSEPNRLYCATFDRGLWRSEDGGSTWRPAGTPQNFFAPKTGDDIEERATTFVSVAPEPETDGRHAVFVGTENSRLYRSVDHGETFDCVSELDLPSRGEWSFPQRPDTHHVHRIAHGTGGRIHLAIEAGAVLIAGDGGRGVQDRLPDSPIDAHVLLTHPMAPGRLYAALGDGFREEGRSYGESRDDGETWWYIGEGLGEMLYAYGLAVNASDPDDIRIAVATGPEDAHRSGGASIFRLDGDRWIEDADGFPGDVGLIPELASDPDVPGQWFALSDQGLFAQRTGDSWRKLTALDVWKGCHPTTLTVLRG